jgi:hypothetical protein
MWVVQREAVLKLNHPLLLDVKPQDRPRKLRDRPALYNQKLPCRFTNALSG